MMFSANLWEHVTDKWFMSITMVFGSFIAGATSEGGGAVAFPVMTLLFDISPAVARDFSLMIQSVGMICAAFTIYCLAINVLWRVILYASIGGLIGMIIGTQWVSPNIPGLYAKSFFVHLWLGFGLALCLRYTTRHRQNYEDIENFSRYKAYIFVFLGLLGGIISSIVGSGIDLLIFSVLSLWFNISPKVATPTSVIIMGLNALFGFLWKGLFSTYSLADEAWHYWYACVPIVVIGAPLGARFIQYCSDTFIVSFLCCLIVLQEIVALFVLPMTINLLLFSAFTCSISCAVFYQMYLHGGTQFTTKKKRHGWKANA